MDGDEATAANVDSNAMSIRDVSAAHPPVAVEFDCAVLPQIRRHARASMDAEVCGVLIGDFSDGVARVSACIAGENAREAGAHVTFTQETWQHIYTVKDAQFPGTMVLGWYHSHPGFGIFLSDYDLFIHRNFFAAPHQIAWVFDPHSDDEGCFGWVGGDIIPIRQFAIGQSHHRCILPPAEAETAEAQRETQKPAQLKRVRKTRCGVSATISALVLMVAFALWYCSARGRPHQPSSSSVRAASGATRNFNIEVGSKDAGEVGRAVKCDGNAKFSAAHVLARSRPGGSSVLDLEVTCEWENGGTTSFVYSFDSKKQAAKFPSFPTVPQISQDCWKKIATAIGQIAARR